jgi:hypothetical protein
MSYYTHVCLGIERGVLSEKLKEVIDYYELSDEKGRPRLSKQIDQLRMAEQGMSPCVEIVEAVNDVYFESDNVNVEIFSKLIQIAMKEVSNNRKIIFQYALTAQRPHIEAYGGGAVMVTKRKITDISTNDIVARWSNV